tara:strand:- start:39837 stop:40508 length:672 start_codon:yes stop_codon:yes gene_type:complete
MQLIKKTFIFLYREMKISFSNLSDLLSNILFFFLSIFIFVFAIGPEKSSYNEIAIGILWSLLILSSTLSLRKYYEEDFKNGTLIILHMSGLSYELIVILKVISHFLFVQIPFLISIPIASIIIGLSTNEILLLFITFSIGSLILSCLGSISASMNLLNKFNFSIGSAIVLLFSIPLIIFSIGILNEPENFNFLFNIILGIAFIFIGITPWSSAASLKLAINNQ